MLVIEKTSNVMVKKEFIEANKENDILLIHFQTVSFGNMKFYIDLCKEIDRWLTVEIGSDFFYISKNNPENCNGARSFLSDRTWKDIVLANFDN